MGDDHSGVEHSRPSAAVAIDRFKALQRYNRCAATTTNTFAKPYMATVFNTGKHRNAGIVAL